MSGITPSDIDNLHDFFETKMQSVHTCMPGEVLKVQGGQHGNQFVDVNLMLTRKVQDEDGKWIDERYPVVPMVPVGAVKGGGFVCWMPLAVGDIVLVHFAERSIDQWIEKARKGKKMQIDPGDIGQHVLEGAIAVPCGPASRPELLADASPTDAIFGKDNGVQVRVTGDNKVKLGGADVTDAVALASKVDDFIAAIDNMFRTWVVVPQDGGAALKAKFNAAFPTAPDSTASDIVKAG